MGVIASTARLGVGAAAVAAGAGRASTAPGHIQAELAAAMGAQAAERHAVAGVGQRYRTAAHVPRHIATDPLERGIGIAAGTQPEPVLPAPLVLEVEIQRQAADLLIVGIADDQAAETGAELEILKGQLGIAPAAVLAQVEG